MDGPNGGDTSASHLGLHVREALGLQELGLYRSWSLIAKRAITMLEMPMISSGSL